MGAGQGEVTILGGGISALAFAERWPGRSTVIEAEQRLGGLCRSFDVGGVACDVGPHIMFSKDQATLEFMRSLAPTARLRRSNRIYFEGRYVKYPFENDLAALPDAARDYCLASFLDNPYREYPADDMLTFFYRTFGEGITRLYLEPYNRKIWKFEPSFMDTQMVERIPCPPPEDIIASAAGRSTEGYLHQLYFHYPEQGGTESLVRGLAARCGERLTAHTGAPVEAVRRRRDGSWEVRAGGRGFDAERLVSTIPLEVLIRCMEPAPPEAVLAAARALRFNSIHITIVHTAEERLADNFAVMVPHSGISFHRLSKLDFLGPAYHPQGLSTLMVETTFRPGDRYDIDKDAVSAMVIDDLQFVGFSPKAACRQVETLSFRHAYVIYDQGHRRNVDTVRGWLAGQGIETVGRFGSYEYINMDAAIARAQAAASALCAAPR